LFLALLSVRREAIAGAVVVTEGRNRLVKRYSNPLAILFSTETGRVWAPPVRQSSNWAISISYTQEIERIKNLKVKAEAEAKAKG